MSLRFELSINQMDDEFSITDKNKIFVSQQTKKGLKHLQPIQLLAASVFS